MDRCHNIPPLPGSGCGSGCEPYPTKNDTFEMVDRNGCVVQSVGTRTSDENTSNFDCWASESADASSTEIKTYVLDRALAASGLEPDVASSLYGEPHRLPRHRGPYRLRGLAKLPEKSTEATENAFGVDFRGTVEIMRTEYERAGLGAPKVGDVVQFWDLPFFAAWGQPHSKAVPGSGFFFDITNVEIGGFPFSGAMFTRFILTIKRDSRYTAERTIHGDLIPGEDFSGI